MGTKLEYDFTEFKRWIRPLTSYNTIRDINDFFGGEIVAISQESFETESDPVTGEAWKKSYRVINEGGQTLSKDGYLKGSIDYYVTTSGIVVGSPLIYARVHNEGAIIKAKNSPYLKFKSNGNWVMKKQVEIPKHRYLGFPSDFEQRTMETPEFQRILRIA